MRSLMDEIRAELSLIYNNYINEEEEKSLMF
jgi:hypothetical protein